MNKKGLASSLIAITTIIFLFGVTSLVSLTMWTEVNEEFQNVDDDIIAPHVKSQINNLTNYMLWGDKIFIAIFIALFVGYLISSVTLPAERGIMLLLYIIYLIFISIFAMVLSNGWEYLIQNPNLITAAQELKFTNFFLTYLPVITLFTGVIGGILFHARTKDDINIRTGGDPFSE